nr:MAG TPA: hypothetical protein [Caudoviricetes sp.]
MTPLFLFALLQNPDYQLLHQPKPPLVAQLKQRADLFQKFFFLHFYILPY